MLFIWLKLLVVCVWVCVYIYTMTQFWDWDCISSVQFSSIAQSCPTLCDPMNCSTPGLPVHHQLPEFTQTHVHRVGAAVHPSHPFSSCLQSFPASGSFPVSWLLISGEPSIGASASASVLPVNIQDWFPLGWTGWISLLSNIYLFKIYFYLFLSCALWHGGFSFSEQRWNLGSLQWKCGILTTRRPGKSQSRLISLLLKKYQSMYCQNHSFFPYYWTSFHCRNLKNFTLF